MKYLIDTCIISEAMKNSPNPKVMEWLDTCAEESVYVSVLTFGELQKGISRLPDSTRKSLMQRWLDFDLPQRFTGRVLDINHEIVSLWGNLLAKKELQGIVLPSIDSLLGATALAHGLIVVTRNTKDIARCDVQCLNPFE